MAYSIIYINKSDATTGETYQDTLKNISPNIQVPIDGSVKSDIQGLYNLTTGTFLSAILQHQTQIIP